MANERRDLEELAAHCRVLANGTDNRDRREKLHELAAEYDAQAARMPKLIMPNPRR